MSFRTKERSCHTEKKVRPCHSEQSEESEWLQDKVDRLQTVY